MIDCYECPLNEAYETILCESNCTRMEEWIAEHDKKIREDAIGKFVYMCRQSMMVCNDGHTCICDMEDIERIAEHIKGEE